MFRIHTGCLTHDLYIISTHFLVCHSVACILGKSYTSNKTKIFSSGLFPSIRANDFYFLEISLYSIYPFYFRLHILISWKDFHKLLTKSNLIWTNWKHQLEFFSSESYLFLYWHYNTKIVFSDLYTLESGFEICIFRWSKTAL